MMTPVEWRILHPGVDLGYLPDMLDADNPASATEQLNAGYRHAGGWRPFHGHTMDRGKRLHYPGDPPLPPIAFAKLHDAFVVLYPHSWVAVIQPDDSFEVCRMD